MTIFFELLLSLGFDAFACCFLPMTVSFSFSSLFLLVAFCFLLFCFCFHLLLYSSVWILSFLSVPFACSFWGVVLLHVFFFFFFAFSFVNSFCLEAIL